MRCRSCSTEIAEKALICYRCGAATSDPKIAPPPPPRERGPLPVIVAILVILAAAVVGMPQLPDGPERMAGWGLVVVVTAVTVWLLRPRSRRRRR